jgi:hypothetical protein
MDIVHGFSLRKQFKNPVKIENLTLRPLCFRIFLLRYANSLASLPSSP